PAKAKAKKSSKSRSLRK
ncbi:histone H1-like Hc1 domain protein, partial [Chlamydia psittaci 02DC14]